MSPTPIELAARRLALQRRSAEQRTELGRHALGLAPVASALDRLRQAFRHVRQNPEWVVAGIALLVVVRPRRALRWARRAWTAWLLIGSARVRLSAAFPARPRPL